VYVKKPLTLKNSDSGGEVVDTPGCAESGGDDGRRGNEIVSEAVVEVSLCDCQSIVSTKHCAHPSHVNRVMPGAVRKWVRYTYLKLKYVVHLFELLLISSIETKSSAVQLLTSLTKVNGSLSSSGNSFNCPSLQPLHGSSVPGGELLEGLLGVRITLKGNRLRESTLSIPGNGGCSVGRDSHAHAANLRCGAYEGHCACQVACGERWEEVREILGARSRQRGCGLVVLVVRLLT
jgi:hypothetical protein